MIGILLTVNPIISFLALIGLFLMAMMILSTILSGNKTVLIRHDYNENRVTQEGIYSPGIKRVKNFASHYQHPDYAEHLIKGEHCWRVQIKGKYGGNIANRDRVIYKCPECKTEHELVFEHGDTVKCKCGLYSQTHGNGLVVWM